MQKIPIHETLYAHGLCMTCHNAASCTFAARVDVPVAECLEFDGEVQVESAPARAPARRARAQAEPSAPGLCGTCDWRESCTYPRRTGGVWFCEEYQ